MNNRELYSKIGIGILKFAVALAIVAYLIHRNPREIIESFKSFEVIWLIPALFCYALHWFCCSERWRLIARMLGVKLSCGETFSICMQAAFFSLVIPGGAIGGDVIKMGAIARRTPAGARVEGIFTVLTDRIVGMIGLFALALLLLIPGTPLLLNISVPGMTLPPNMLKLGIAALALLCVAGIAAALAIFFHVWLEKIPGVKYLISRVDQLSGGKIERLMKSSDIYASRWRELLVFTVLSVFLVHLLCCAPLFFLLRGLGVEFSYFSVIVAGVIGNIAGVLLPLPSGIGGRDLATITILAASGITTGDAKTAQLLLTGIILCFNLCGGIFFLAAPISKSSREGN